MAGLADEDEGPPLLPGLRSQLLDAGDIGAGGVHHPDALGRQGLQHVPALAVGAEDDGVAASQGIRVLGLLNAGGAEFLHHVGVVDEVPQHPAAAVFLRRCPGQVHRPVDAVAEAGALGQDHSHRGSPPTFWPPRA